VAWYRFDAARGLLTLVIQAQPGAKKPGIEPYGKDALKVRIAAPAVDGRANDALRDLIAERLSLPNSAVRVVRGATARRKLVEVRTAHFDPLLLCDAASKRNKP
jgi:uncharacterized protein (TIGR00251 family)